MIQIDQREQLLDVAVIGRFRHEDFVAFEAAVGRNAHFGGALDLFLDLRDMLDYSLDVAWDDVRFSRAHARDFRRIAVVTGDQWLAWSTWINRFFMQAEIRLFEDDGMARAWLAGNQEAAA
jgi:hypothetical protein